VAVAFPKGSIERPQKKVQEVAGGAGFLQYGIFLIPLIALVVMGYLWYTRGRDPRRAHSVVTVFDPPQGVSPAVAGIVYNERIEPREITAEILRLAVEGYLMIHRIEKKVFIVSVVEYLLESKKDEAPEDPFQAQLLAKLFQPQYLGTEMSNGKEVRGALLSKMHHTFAEDRNELITYLYQEVLDKGYFPERPDAVRKRYFVAGGALFFVGIGVAFLLGGVLTQLYFSIAMGIASMVVLGVGIWMPVRTEKGVTLRAQLEGYRRYLKVAEKDRIAFHNAPERTSALFEAHLPFAVAFGIEKEWAKQFAGVHMQEPTWHAGVTTINDATAFVHEVNTFSSDFISATMPTSSGTSGSAGAGKGLGGGRGGEW
jgi:hypothetical protein